MGAFCQPSCLPPPFTQQICIHEHPSLLRAGSATHSWAYLQLSDVGAKPRKNTSPAVVKEGRVTLQSCYLNTQQPERNLTTAPWVLSLQQCANKGTFVHPACSAAQLELATVLSCVLASYLVPPTHGHVIVKPFTILE